MKKMLIAGLAALVVTAMPLHAQRTDPTDSLYALARKALTADNNRRAADLFGQLVQRYPNSSRAQDAMYYHAYALYRSGSRSELTEALDELQRYSRTYRDGVYADDADDLQIRVCGELARTGDERCGRAVSARATGRGPGAVGTAGTAGSVGAGPGSGAVTSAGAGPGSSSGRTTGSGGNARATASSRSGNDNDDERMMALNALMQSSPANAVPLLKQVLEKRDEGSVALRKQALFLISQKRSPDVVDIILSSAKNDPNEDVRGTAVFWLSSTQDSRVVPVLTDLLMTSRDLETQKKAIFSISQIQDTKAREALRDVVTKRDMPLELRETAIFWLGNQGANTQYLRDLYSQLTERQLKDKVVATLGQHGGGREILMEIARNPREETSTRGSAIFWLGQSGGGAAGELSALYGSLDNAELKGNVIFALAQSRQSLAMDKLIDIARSDKDKDMRSKALFWIGQSRDPRAVKFLAELIRG